LEHLLFAAYLIFFAWLVTKIRFFTSSGLSSSQLIIFFLLKVMAGIFYGWIGVYYGNLAQMVDTWAYHYESMQEYEVLKNDPAEFFRSLFHNPYEGGYTNFLVTKDSWWNDFKANVFIKGIAIMNLFSFGNYYTNLIFYSFLSLFGPVAIYRVMKEEFPLRKVPILLATFLVPSFIYWTSGLHKDGIIFTGFALITFSMYFGLKERSFRIKRILILLLGLAIVLALRNFLVIPLIGAMIAWTAAAFLKQKPIKVFALVYLFFMIIFFTGRYIHPKLDFPNAVAIKQGEFLALGGGSAVEVERVNASVWSFIGNAPQAFSLSVLRPFPTDVRHLLSLAAAVEINILLFLFLCFLIYRVKGNGINAFALFCLFFAFSILMMIGYSVNVLGAIVRYRSIVFPFLIVPMAAYIDWKRIYDMAKGYIIKN
jgi:hypothetical protein